MLLVLAVDLDDDLGRKTGSPTPVLGRENVENAVTRLATADPEDSDVNVLFQAIHTRDQLEREGEEVAVAAVTGVDGSDVKANRAVGEEVDTVLAALSTGENVRAVVITDGAQDESVLPVIRSRVPIDGLRRVVVRQAQDLESIYYTIKQVLGDKETRGTLLVPLGVLLLVYPMVLVANAFDVAGFSVLGVLSGLLGLYTLFRGLGLEDAIDEAAEELRQLLYAGRVTLVTYIVAFTLIAIGGWQGYQAVTDGASTLPIPAQAAVFIHAAVGWLAAAGVTSSLGQVTDEYLDDEFRWRYLNAPFYVLAISVVLHAVSGFFLPGEAAMPITDLALALTAGTLLGVLSTLTFAIAENRFPATAEAA